MRKSLAAVALCFVFAYAFSASSVSSVRAMPAPEPGNVELSVGLTQWGAETEAPAAMNETELLASFLDLARPRPATRTKTAMCETLAAAAQIHDLPVGFFVRLINQESGFNPEVVSPAGAQGVAQFMPKVAEEWGLRNPFDPHTALVASARFLRSLYTQFGNWGLAAAAYNGGMGRVQKWIDKRGKLPDETRHYVKTITGVPADQWANGKPQSAKFSIPKRAPCQEIAHLADPHSEFVPSPLPAPASIRVVQRVVQRVVHAAGPPTKTTNVKVTNVVISTVKGGAKVAKITVKGESKIATVRGTSKVAAIKGEIAKPMSIIADAQPSKVKRDKAIATAKAADKQAPVKVAGKQAPKTQAKAKDAKEPTKAKGRIQVADARK